MNANNNGDDFVCSSLTCRVIFLYGKIYRNKFTHNYLVYGFGKIHEVPYARDQNKEDFDPDVPRFLLIFIAHQRKPTISAEESEIKTI